MLLSAIQTQLAIAWQMQEAGSGVELDANI